LTSLRRISTRRLLSICALALVIVIGGTAVALATSGGGPKPPAKPLANAVHDSLEAPSVPGVSADIHFSNHLIDASSLEGKDPILAGANGRLWYSPAGEGKLRLELQAEESGNDSQVLVEGRHFTIYDGTSETVYEGELPEETGKHAEGGEEGKTPSVASIEEEIDRLGKNLDLSGAIPSDVAGQATYTVKAAPSHDGGLLGRVELAWDAANGIPLRAAVYSSESSSPVLELEATSVSFEAVSDSVFEISPPAGAKVVDLSPAELQGHDGDATEISGEAAVSRAVDFPLAAPQSIAGLPRTEVRAIEVDGHTAALVTYGKGLGGIAVIESKASSGGEAGGSKDGGSEFSLPKVTIGDVKGEELDTALGSALTFSRAGVDYILVGSVPPTAIEAAARGL
jgi:outer membrane lipoprotein-sorting protein